MSNNVCFPPPQHLLECKHVHFIKTKQHSPYGILKIYSQQNILHYNDRNNTRCYINNTVIM